MCCSDPRVKGAAPASVFWSGVTCDGSYCCGRSDWRPIRIGGTRARLQGLEWSIRIDRRRVLVLVLRECPGSAEHKNSNEGPACFPQLHRSYETTTVSPGSNLIFGSVLSPFRRPSGWKWDQLTRRWRKKFEIVPFFGVEEEIST